MEEKNKKRESHVSEPVTDGKVVEKTKLQKALGVFFADDLENIKDSIVDDYIKPRSRSFAFESVDRIKEFIADSINGLVGAILFPKGRKRDNDVGGYYKGTYVNYRSAYMGSAYNSSYNSDNRVEKVPPTMLKPIVIKTRGEAQKVLGDLIDICRRYDVATVADYYQLCRIIPSQVDYDYGWHGLINADILPREGGYIIDLPRPQPLD